MSSEEEDYSEELSGSGSEDEESEESGSGSEESGSEEEPEKQKDKKKEKKKEVPEEAAAPRIAFDSFPGDIILALGKHCNVSILPTQDNGFKITVDASSPNEPKQRLTLSINGGTCRIRQEMSKRPAGLIHDDLSEHGDYRGGSGGMFRQAPALGYDATSASRVPSALHPQRPSLPLPQYHPAGTHPALQSRTAADLYRHTSRTLDTALN
eukprot:gnl/Dysnectes_brevis/3910_a5078_815.p1 GENE.gnl/Dysnectes_brevis/3910_a5078_815~~gnl/Dysnectes_brevis/3910_a5078_815.p1  ORF type:complete len:210 (-),score=23.29 gnl/Dysnectes_brevis/3910_a5078_815:93-722(-)